MEIDLTAPSSELGRVLARELDSSPPARSRRPGSSGRVLINLLSQPPNSLLHDGHRWRKLTPSRLLRDTRGMLEDPAHGDVDFIVHASYAFLRAAEAGSAPSEAILPIVEAALEAESLVLADPRPSCVIRLGYLYGPDSRDLKAYRTAFRVLRPYWAGPTSKRVDHIHHADAVRALLLAAARQPADRLLYATDGTPASFAAFMDHFARLMGNPLPVHLPRLSRPVVRLFIAEEHMELVALGVRGQPRPMLPRFEPRFPDYRSGLSEVVSAWS